MDNPLCDCNIILSDALCFIAVELVKRIDQIWDTQGHNPVTVSIVLHAMAMERYGRLRAASEKTSNKKIISQLRPRLNVEMSWNHESS